VSGLVGGRYEDEEGKCSVEALALQHYAQEDQGGWAGLHCEGSVRRQAPPDPPAPDATHKPFLVTP
jgi:hypothetical protein